MKTVVLFVALVFSSSAFAEGINSKPVAGRLSIQASSINNIDGWRGSSTAVIKVEDEVDGRKVVCYGLTSSSYDGGRALTCLQIQK